MEVSEFFQAHGVYVSISLVFIICALSHVPSYHANSAVFQVLPEGHAPFGMFCVDVGHLQIRG